jgi:hypothetical protein
MNKWLAILLGLVIIGAVALPFNHIGMMDEALACNTGTPGPKIRPTISSPTIYPD